MIEETGVGLRNPLFFIGVVENNDDKRFEGRVQVRAFSVHGTQDQVKTESLPWAVCAAGNYDPNNPPPPLNSFVYGMFIDGRDAQQPIVLGLLPTQFAEKVDPQKHGWGVIPEKDGELNARGSSPRDAGKPQQSPLFRVEELDETYITAQEMNRKEKMKIAGTDKTWSEPSSAYASEYPYNRVIETTRHSIELDDTPGAERIMIHHKEGGFIQIDSKGSMLQKTPSDRYDVSGGNVHESSEGAHYVTIGGNAHVYVKGNKIEEIEGDYTQIVHGNVLLGSGGQFNINGSEQVQIRAADVKIEANVGTLGLKSNQLLQLDSLIDLRMTSQKEYHSALRTFEVNSGLVINMQTGLGVAGDINFSSSNMYISATGTVPPVTPLPPFVVGQPQAVPSPTYLSQPGLNIFSGVNTNIKTGGICSIDTVGATTIKSGGLMQIQAGAALDVAAGGLLQMVGGANVNVTSALKIDMFAPNVNIDTLVNLGSGIATAGAVSPAALTPVGIPAPPTIVLPIAGTKLPEPPAKSTQLSLTTPFGSINLGGFVAWFSGE